MDAKVRKAVIALHDHCEEQDELGAAEVFSLVEQVCTAKDVPLAGYEISISETPKKWDVWP